MIILSSDNHNCVIMKSISFHFKLLDAKEQTLGNLANFAYDPINYGYMRQLQIIDLFLYALSESNPRLVRFAIGGICNLSLGKSIGKSQTIILFYIAVVYQNILFLDPINRIYILRNQGVELVSSLLSSQDDQILLSAVSSLMFLTTPESRSKTTTPEIIKEMTKLTSSDNTRVKNLAIIFLDDCEATKLESTKETYGN